ncbi:hypothetical protein Trydic_g21201 [Trypoxylus dichotomus]
MVSLDLEKAFDKIRHEELLLKMKDCGFPATILKTVKTYLQNMSFYTAVNGIGSSARRMKSGVPQGSALGPVLFTIYIRDTPKPQGHREFNAIYADDTAIAATSKHSKIAAELAQALSTKMEEFFCTWDPKINPRKIAFTRTHQVMQQEITVARTEVECSGQIEYFGMILHKELTFSEHLKRARTRVIGRIFHLYSLLSNPKMSILLHKLLIRPILTYASPSWRLVPHVSRRTALAALEALVDREGPQKFLDKLNKGFFEKILARKNPALKTATSQKTYGATKHRTVKEEKLGSARKTSISHVDTQMSTASSRKENIGGRRTEEGNPANQRSQSGTCWVLRWPRELSKVFLP